MEWFWFSSLFATGILQMLCNTLVKLVNLENVNTCVPWFILSILPKVLYQKHVVRKNGVNLLIVSYWVMIKAWEWQACFPTPPLCVKAFGLEPCQISTAILGESLAQTPLFTMSKFEEKENSEIMAAESLAEIIRITKWRDVEEKVRKITLEKVRKITLEYMLQWGHTQFSTKIFISRDLYNFYNEKVYCDIDTELKINTGTIDQSQNRFKERK